MAKMLGYTPEEMLGKHLFYFVDDKQTATIKSIMANRNSGNNDVLNYDFEFRHKDGSTRILSVNTRAILSKNGKLIELLGTFIDVTERKKALEALQSSEEKFSKAFHSNPAAMTITQMADGKIIDANESFEHLFGYRHDETIGHTTSDLGVCLTETERDLEVKRLLEHGKLEPHEVIFGTKSGERLNVIFSVELITFGGQRCILSTVMDISERKKAEEKLKAALEELNLANKSMRNKLGAQ